jgi:hypothetical protein
MEILTPAAVRRLRIPQIEIASLFGTLKNILGERRECLDSLEVPDLSGDLDFDARVGHRNRKADELPGDRSHDQLMNRSILL